MTKNRATDHFKPILIDQLKTLVFCLTLDAIFRLRVVGGNVFSSNYPNNSLNIKQIMGHSDKDKLL
jgi:hypothetical protein